METEGKLCSPGAGHGAETEIMVEQLYKFTKKKKITESFTIGEFYMIISIDKEKSVDNIQPAV